MNMTNKKVSLEIRRHWKSVHKYDKEQIVQHIGGV
jgi:hypothetical protein